MFTLTLSTTATCSETSPRREAGWEKVLNTHAADQPFATSVPRGNPVVGNSDAGDVPLVIDLARAARARWDQVQLAASPEHEFTSLLREARVNPEDRVLLIRIYELAPTWTLTTHQLHLLVFGLMDAGPEFIKAVAADIERIIRKNTASLSLKIGWDYVRRFAEVSPCYR